MKNIKFAKIFLTVTLTVIVILTLLTIPQNNKPPQQQMYIWQRNWNPDVLQGIKKWQGEINGFRILAGFSKGEKISTVKINWQWLVKNNTTSLVYRINGRKLPEAQWLNELILQQINQAKQAGVSIESIEIDYDAATSKLHDYSNWLKQLKHLIHPNLSITALPTWATSGDIKSLLAVVDHYVLQVHSVFSPQQGLFDKKLATDWAQQFDSLSNTPFSIALPNYWYQVNLDKNKQIKSLSAEERSQEQPQNSPNTSQMLFASPLSIHQAMQSIKELKLKHFQGWVWFRMPTDSDKRIFTDKTLKHLLESDKDKVNWQLQASTIQLKPVKPQSHNYDLWLTNPNSIDTSTEIHYLLPEHCQVKHLISGFKPNSNKIIPNHRQLLKAQSEKRIGWVSCGL